MCKFKRQFLDLAVATAVVSGIAGAGGYAEAAVISVDGTVCKLADAITAANLDKATAGCSTGSGADTLLLTAPSYTLSKVDNDIDGFNGLPSVTSAMTLQGDPDEDRQGVTIQRSGDAGTPGFRLLHVATTGQLVIKRVTVSNGDIDGHGGGIFNRGSLELISSNVVHSLGRGGNGGIYNEGGTVNLSHSRLADNGFSSGCGYGLWNESGLVSLSYSVVSSNGGHYGGGIYNKGLLSLTATTLLKNFSLVNCSGIENEGRMHIVSSSILRNGTVSGSASICNHGSAFVINTTISGNDGDGFANSGNAELKHVTVTGSMPRGDGWVGTGISSYGGGSLRLTNSVVAHNAGSDCSGSVSFSGVNLIGDGSCDVAKHGGFAGDPKLGALLENGGPTLTHALLVNSPAANRATDTLCRALDERGAKRPQGDHCDLGAFEQVQDAGPPLVPVLSFFDQAVSDGTLAGKGRSADQRNHRLEAERNQFLLAADFLKRGLTARACTQLKAARARIDTIGSPDGNDYVTGTASADLLQTVEAALAGLGCTG
jgi:hypothetical protein